MQNSLFKKLIFSIFVLLGSIWMICYLISLIPGNASDFYAEDSNTQIINNQAEKLPVFYFSVLPAHSTEDISIPSFFPNFKWNGSQNIFIRQNLSKYFSDDHSSNFRFSFWEFK